MMGRTHLVGGIAALWLVEPFISSGDADALEFWLLGAGVGSLLPDLDASESLIRHVGFGRGIYRIEPFQPLAWWLHRSFGHRGLVHSLFGLGVVTALTLPLGIWFSPFLVAGLSLGFISHLYLDGLTKSGVPLWDRPQWAASTAYRGEHRRRVHFLPRGWRISTGSQAEEVVFVICSALALTLLLRHSATPP